jgi:hypothetical protein
MHLDEVRRSIQSLLADEDAATDARREPAASK